MGFGWRGSERWQRPRVPDVRAFVYQEGCQIDVAQQAVEGAWARCSLAERGVEDAECEPSLAGLAEGRSSRGLPPLSTAGGSAAEESSVRGEHR